jgi:hypothetical protein
MYPTSKYEGYGILRSDVVYIGTMYQRFHLSVKLHGVS